MPEPDNDENTVMGCFFILLAAALMGFGVWKIIELVISLFR
jgi:uncharacterized membrane protein